MPPFKLPTFDEVLIEWNSIGSVGDLKGIIDTCLMSFVYFPF